MSIGLLSASCVIIDASKLPNINALEYRTVNYGWCVFYAPWYSSLMRILQAGILSLLLRQLLYMTKDRDQITTWYSKQDNRNTSLVVERLYCEWLVTLRVDAIHMSPPPPSFTTAGNAPSTLLRPPMPSDTGNIWRGVVTVCEQVCWAYCDYLTGLVASSVTFSEYGFTGYW